MPITWNATMATGVSAIDDEHRELFRQVNYLVEAMTQGRGRQELAQILDFAGDYVKRHFAHEERCMAEHQCPAAAENKRAHAQFIATFTKLRKQFDTSGAAPTLVLEIHSTLTAWLTNHIGQIDVRLRPCVAGVPVVAENG